MAPGASPSCSLMLPTVCSPFTRNVPRILMRIGLAMARRVSALVTVTAASSGSCPSLEFVSFIVEDSFPSPPIIYKFLYKYSCFDLNHDIRYRQRYDSLQQWENVYSGARSRLMGALCARLSVIRLWGLWIMIHWSRAQFKACWSRHAHQYGFYGPPPQPNKHLTP